MGKASIGVIGLGNMGGNIARRLHDSGFGLVLYDRSEEKFSAFDGIENVARAGSLQDLAERLRQQGDPIAWVMLPAGAATNDTVAKLSELMGGNAIIIDASNSKYEDSMHNYGIAKCNGVSYLDVGCAGGPDQVLKGVALMVGGDREAFVRAENVFKAVSGSGTYGYVGDSGSGHKTKLVHNIIFYGIFPVYAEGVDMLLKLSGSGGNFNVTEAMRLLAASPPINRDIMTAMAESQLEAGRDGEAPEIRVSDMVSWGEGKANEAGAQLIITSDILRGYRSLSSDARWIYSIAKKRITGH